jgi:hypothetical protein
MSNEPVAWGMPRRDGQIVDVITPEEHERVEGGYTVPLYTQDDTALLRQALEALENLGRFDSRPSSIWTYFYASAKGDFVNLREFREKAEPAITALRERLGEKT